MAVGTTWHKEIKGAVDLLKMIREMTDSEHTDEWDKYYDS